MSTTLLAPQLDRWDEALVALASLAAVVASRYLADLAADAGHLETSTARPVCGAGVLGAPPWYRWPRRCIFHTDITPRSRSLLPRRLVSTQGHLRAPEYVGSCTALRSGERARRVLQRRNVKSLDTGAVGGILCCVTPGFVRAFKDNLSLFRYRDIHIH
jgi:hypothetical protein